MSRIAVPLIVLVLVGLCVALAVSLKNSQAEDVSKKIGLDQRLGNKLPLDAVFRDEHNAKVKLGDYFGKRPVVLMLVFYSCQSSCQLEIENAMKSFSDMKVQDIGRDYDVVAISIYPKENAALALAKKADVLSGYARPGAYDGTHFLTGELPQIKRDTDAVGYRFTYDPLKDRILHPTGLFVVTADGRLSRYLYGVDYASPLLSASLRTAGAGEINVPSEPILFGCINVDPHTGKTTLNVFRALRVGGIATVIILALSIFLMSRGKDGRLKPAPQPREEAGS